jgi:hypothetical protein
MRAMNAKLKNKRTHISRDSLHDCAAIARGAPLAALSQPLNKDLFQAR